VPAVDPRPLVELVISRPKLRLVVLNGLMVLRGEPLARLSAAGDVYFDIAMLEGVGGLARLLKHVPLDQVLFGSHAPFFVWEAAMLKLREAGLGEHQRNAIASKNSWSLLRSPPDH
jgi:predicted TIM-barrel fold metal-dependent hydrolase